MMNFNVSHRQHEAPKEDKGLIDLLAVLLIGGIGMFVALAGLYFDNPFLFIAGSVIVIGSAWSAVAKAGKATVEFIAAIRNFIWENQDRKKNENK